MATYGTLADRMARLEEKVANLERIANLPPDTLEILAKAQASVSKAGNVSLKIK